MTAQHLAWLLLGVASGVASGYPWGRWNGRRALDRAWDDGRRDFIADAADMLGQGYEMRLGRNGPYWHRPDAERHDYDWGREDGYADALDDLDAWPKDGELGTVDQIAAPGPAGPQHLSARAREPQPAPAAAYPLDWRERTAIELAPETLANDVPRARTGGRPVTPEQPGPGHRGPPPAWVREWDNPEDAVYDGYPDDLADELAAEAEAHLARHTETHDEWIARMDYEHALWCAETGLVNEWAAAA